MILTWELITSLVLASGGVMATAAFIKGTRPYRSSARDKAELDLANAQAALELFKAESIRLKSAVRASVPKPGTGLPEADGSKTYCAWHDDLVPLADMVWAEWGSEYVCTDCAEKHGLEVPEPETADISASALIPIIAQAPRGNGGRTVLVKGQPIPPQYLPVTAGVHDNSEPWALFASEDGARQWAQDWTKGMGAWTIKRENQHWRVDIGQHAVSRALRPVDPGSLAGQTMSKAGDWEAPSEQSYELHTADENWTMEQLLRASAGVPGAMIGIAESEMNERHLADCPNMHQVNGAGQVVRCIAPGPKSRVFDTDGKITGPVRPTGGVPVRKHPDNCTGKHVVNAIGVVTHCKGPCHIRHLVDGNGWMRACGRRGCEPDAVEQDETRWKVTDDGTAPDDWSDPHAVNGAFGL